MDLGLTGRTAYVTGAAHGIGAAICDRLALEGAYLAVSDLDEATLRSRSGGWTVNDRPPTIIEADLSNADQTRGAARSAVDALDGRVDVVINNVGRAENIEFGELTDQDWQRSFDLNLMSCVRTCQELLPIVARSEHRAVVIVSSDLAKQPEPVPMEYGAMKAALLYLTKALSIQHAPTRVNAVTPGPIMTRLWTAPGGIIEQLADRHQLPPDQALEKYLASRHLPLGIGEPHHVADTVAYLASTAAGHITGTSIDIGGTIRGLV